ncbi:hypothetical protein D7D52_20395 [Nocardia yunnanensis]|uniref:STAS domain-containing protein n=1 Tax=Nocardia yunnanensis TaxID=2382165 RepID=A0A386ZE45_9NOCA|nr:ATP-binding protein [Nocardia yunnanensis]AYF75810.1 hypothetical protein D7D52_20395 [Nocardia yunnanensis]
MSRAPIQWERAQQETCTIVSPRGLLDARSYRRFADDLLKFATAEDEPHALIVIVDGLRIGTEAVLTVFTRVADRLQDWPGIPLLLVADDNTVHQCLTRRALGNFVRIHSSLREALDAVDAPPPRRCACLHLAPGADCPQRARRFVDDVCEHWDIVGLRPTARLVTLELVENAFLHARVDGDIGLRLELRDSRLTIAVSDPDPHMAIPCDPDPQRRRFYGLHIVTRLTSTWGCTPQWLGGKVVWATLTLDQRATG